MADASAQAAFDGDRLSRQAYADRLAELIKVLACAPHLPAGRVLAVDAPWGSGKTYIASRLPSHWRKERGIGRCIYVNAFEFDYHHDAFAVLASAILDALAGNEVVEDLKGAAGAVLRAALPGVGKAMLNAAAAAAGLGAVVDAIREGAGDVSEAAIEAMLDSFAASKSSAEEFKAKLAKAAKAAGGPLVVVVDELDRCRPDFALEMLERIKHLFNVEGVAFVLFLHGEALYSAVRHTYGDGIDPVAYLRKFISLTVGVPRSISNSGQREDETATVWEFLNANYGAEYFNPNWMHNLAEGLSQLVPIFGASLRDLESAVLLGSVIRNQRNAPGGEATAYAAMLYLCDREHARALLREPTIEDFNRELSRLRPMRSGSNFASYYYDAFTERSGQQLQGTTAKETSDRRQLLDSVMSALQRLDAAGVRLPV